MNDEHLYLQATKEVDDNKIQPALWAKVMALAEGDKDKAKYQYIKLRVVQLALEKPDFEKKVIDDFDLEYMPVGEFSKLRGITSEKVIIMIKGGFYTGQIKDDDWFVSRHELTKDEQLPVSVSVGVTMEPAAKTSQEYILVSQFAEHKGMVEKKVIEMIKEGLYQGRLFDDVWHIAYHELDKAGKASPAAKGDLAGRLFRGEVGLAMTYWFYGGIINLLFLIPVTIAEQSQYAGVALTLFVLVVVYNIFIAISIWNSAENYTGPTVWKVLARFAVIMGFLGMFVEFSKING